MASIEKMSSTGPPSAPLLQQQQHANSDHRSQVQHPSAKHQSSSDQPDSLPASLRFNTFDVLCIALSILTYILDLSTDLYLCYVYYNQGALHYFIITLLLILIPAVTMSAFSLRWYLLDEDERGEVEKQYNYGEWVARMLFLLLQLAPVLRYIDSMRYGLKSKSSSGDLKIKYYTRMANEDSDATLLRLFECFMEAAPQCSLQLYIYFSFSSGMSPYSNSSIQLLAIGASLVSLAWGLSSYSKSLRYPLHDKLNISYGGTVVMFLWHLAFISSRILAISLFSSCHPLLIIPILSIHMTLMFLWLFYEERARSCEELLFNLIVSFVYLFTYFNVRDERTRFKYLFYYCVVFLENSLFILVWYLYCGEDLGLLIAQPALFLLAIMLMLVYYKWLHPSLSSSVQQEPPLRTRSEILTRRTSLDNRRSSVAPTGKRRSNSCSDAPIALQQQRHRPGHSRNRSWVVVVPQGGV